MPLGLPRGSSLENYVILEQTNTAYLFGNALAKDDITEIAIIEVDNIELICYVYITQIPEQATTEFSDKKTEIWHALSKAKNNLPIQLK